MPRGEKKPVLAMPHKMILTADGSAYFLQQNKKLEKIRTAENTAEYGLFLNAITFPSLQRMILCDYVSRLETSMAEFKAFRKELIDMSKLIVYSVLYKQFNIEVKNQIYETDFIKQHNRQNPQQSFDSKMQVNELALKDILEKKKDMVLEIRTRILNIIDHKISQKQDTSVNEKQMLGFVAEKFIDNLDFMFWFMIVRFYDTAALRTFIDIVINLLDCYLDRTNLAEYVSLMILELARYCENSNLRRIAYHFYGDKMDINKIIFDPVMRTKLNEELLNRKEFVHVAWKITPITTQNSPEQTKLLVTLYNRDSNFKRTRDIFNSMRNFDMGNRSLIDLHNEVMGSDKTMNLGIYYLSYLNENCQKYGIKFETTVGMSGSTELTLINLGFTF